MNKIYIYGHSGSGNHGNEAIVRGLIDSYDLKEVNVISSEPGLDLKFGLNEVCNIIPLQREVGRYSITNVMSFILNRCKIRDFTIAKRHNSIFSNITKGDIFLFEAGDQCFEILDVIKNYYNFSLEAKKRGANLVFLMGSVPESRVKELSFFLDLFDEIILRESISYNAVKNEGYKNIYFSPCPAFEMNAKEDSNAKIFVDSKTEYVGITIGLLAQNKASFNEKLFYNIEKTVKHILDTTEYGILLIPHVNSYEQLSDVVFLNSLYAKYKDNKRIKLINENSANIQKYYISNCSALITVRTHASIAAYSSYVPALVIGYSQKSRGISKDIFGEEKLIFPIENLSNDNSLINAVDDLLANKNLYNAYLKNRIPLYLAPLKELGKNYERGN